MFVAVLLRAEFRDWCALEAVACWARSAVRRAHPILRSEVSSWTFASGCETVWELGRRIACDCIESDVTACWSMLGETQHIPINPASPQVDQSDGNSLLHIALATTGDGAASMVAFLLSRPGAETAAQERNIRKQTALHICAHHGRAKAARRILLRCNGVDVDAQDQYETTPLMEAVRQEHPMMVRTLLARRANPNTFVANCQWHGETPLNVAVRMENIDIARQLVAAPGIDLHQKSHSECSFGKEALEFARENGEVRRILVDALDRSRTK